MRLNLCNRKYERYEKLFVAKNLYESCYEKKFYNAISYQLIFIKTFCFCIKGIDTSGFFNFSCGFTFIFENM